MTESYVRENWADALRHVKRGTELSSIIHYGFNNNDLVELTQLHKANKFRQKIEDLLEDCNFHYECGLLNAQRYSRLELELTSKKVATLTKENEQIELFIKYDKMGNAYDFILWTTDTKNNLTRADALWASEMFEAFKYMLMLRDTGSNR